MFKMGSYDPFGHLQHKLWPKEGSGVKLPIWFLTTKSQESPQFPYVQVACQISLESSWQGLQLCFKPHLHPRSEHKVMCPQSCAPKLRESQLWEFRDSHLGVLRQNDIWVLVPSPGMKYFIRGKVVASPKFKSWWVFWDRVCLWLVLALKCSNYVLTNLLFGLCRSVWVVDACHFSYSPSRSFNTPLCPQSAVRHGTCPNFLLFRCSLHIHIWVYQGT
jgi:hypothetical protein